MTTRGHRVIDNMKLASTGVSNAAGNDPIGLLPGDLVKYRYPSASKFYFCLALYEHTILAGNKVLLYSNGCFRVSYERNLILA